MTEKSNAIRRLLDKLPKKHTRGKDKKPSYYHLIVGNSDSDIFSLRNQSGTDILTLPFHQMIARLEKEVEQRGISG